MHIRNTVKRSILFMMVGLLVLPSFLNIFIQPQPVHAASANPKDQLERWLYYKGMRACFEDPYFEAGTTGDDNETISVSDINEGHLYIHDSKGGVGSVGAFGSKTEGFGYLAKDMDGLDGSDGTVDCTDGSIWVRGAHIFGFPNVINLICAMNNALDGLGDGGRIDPQRDGGTCVDAQEVKFDGGSSIFQQALTKALENPIASAYGGDGDRPDFDFNDNGGPDYTYKSLLYLLGKYSLETFCGGPLESAKANNGFSDPFGAEVNIVSSDGTLKKSGFGEDGFSYNYPVTNEDRENKTSSINDIYYKQGGNANEADDRTCDDMARWTREGAVDYAKWAKLHGTEAENNENSSTNDDPTSGAGDSTTSCGVDGVGWIICPVMDFMGKLNDAAFGFIDNFLYVEPRLLTDTDTKAAWSNFRDLANIAFIIAFLVIVYSQITGAGVSNYGIKRMLPRIFIAALLVNLSYFICQIAVDLSNIAGSSLYSFFKDIPTTDAITATAESMPSWQKIIAFILIGTGVVAVGLLAISAIGTAALLAFVLVMLILIARKALLIILVVIAPLAFVAYLLPNTEKWFKGWWKMFSTLLMVFPIVAVIFGASTLAARIINNAGGEPDESNYMLQITALGVMALPLFAIPAVLKGAMSAAGSIGGRLQGMADKSQSKAAGKVKDRYESSVAGQYMKFRSGEADKRRALIQSGAYSGRGGKLNPRNLRAGAMKRINTANLPGSVGEFGDRLAASGAALENKMWDEEVGRQRDLITVGKNMTNEQILKEMQAGSGSAEYQAALGSVIMKRNHRESHLKALEIVRTRQEAASLSGNTQEAGIVSGMQKQMLHDGAANMPWAVGDQAMGAMENGVWGASGQAGHGKTLNEQMQGRVGTHMSVANLAKMNPDELKSVHKMAKNGQLSAGELATLQKAITELRVDEQYKGSEKPNATGLYDEILSGSYAPDPTTGTGSRHYNESDVF